MTLSERDITELVGMIMSTALDLEVETLVSGATGALRAPVVQAAIQIEGTWTGAVVLHASEEVAARCAQRLFHLGTTPPSPEDVRDALGELINMAGGGIKGLVTEGGARLSLPVVSRGDDYTVRPGRGRQIHRLEYICEGEPLVITVLEGPSGA